MTTEIEKIPAILGWGVTRYQVPCFYLRGPWERLGNGQARDQRGPYGSREEAKAANVGELHYWQIEPGQREKTEIWRNYKGGELAVEIATSPEQDAREHGYTCEYLPGWIRAIPLAD